MRKRLPPNAKAFLELLHRQPDRIAEEFRHYIRGNYPVPYQNVPTDLRGSNAHIRVFTAVAENWDLHAGEAREAFMALPPDDRYLIDEYIKAEIAEEISRA